MRFGLWISLLLLWILPVPTSGTEGTGEATLPWVTSGRPPKRWLVIHLAIRPEDTAQLDEVWSKIGVRFSHLDPGFLRVDDRRDLALWLRTLEKGPALSPLPKVVASEPALSPVARFRLEREELAPDLFSQLDRILHQDWKLCLFSFDARQLASDPQWLTTLMRHLAVASPDTGIFFATYSPSESRPAARVATPGVARGEGGPIDRFYLAQRNPVALVRLASRLKQSGKYEAIFTRQQTPGGSHFIATYSQVPGTVPAETSRALEITYAETSPPDLIAIPSYEKLKAISPGWLWSPHLTQSPTQVDRPVTWLETLPYLLRTLQGESDSHHPLYPLFRP